MKSISQKLLQLEGLIDTRDITPWQNSFLQSVMRQKADTTKLTEKQIDVIEDIYKRHFA